MAVRTLIKEHRTKARLSQFQLAVKLGVDPATVSRWERGAAVPSTEHMSALARVFAVTVDALLAVSKRGSLPPSAA